MNRKNYFYAVILVVWSSVLISSCSQTTPGWPQFRGPENNMVASGEMLPTAWNDSLNVLWSCALTGEGFSSPIIYGDKIFITSAFLEKAAPAIEKPAQQMPPPPPIFNSQISFPVAGLYERAALPRVTSSVRTLFFQITGVL